MREYRGIAKEGEAMLTKLPYGTVIYVLSFCLPGKVARLFWETNKAE